MNEETCAMIAELRRNIIAATLAYQEQHGECVDKNNLLGAMANTVLFRFTLSDVQELASALNARNLDDQNPHLSSTG